MAGILGVRTLHARSVLEEVQYPTSVFVPFVRACIYEAVKRVTSTGFKATVAQAGA